MAQASQQVQPSAEFMSVLRQIPFMDDKQLAGLTASPAYGALALTEVSKRNRDRLMRDAQKQAMAAGRGGETIADRELAALAQQQMQEKLAADERVGLNNIVAQAEQGALEFGEPVGAAGGGMIAFEHGGKVPGFAAGAFIPLAARALAMYGPRILPKLGMEAGKRGIGALKAHPYIAAGVGTAAGIPFGLGALDDEEEAFTPEQYQKQYEAQDVQEGRPKIDRDVTRGAGRGEGSGAGGRGGISGLDLDDDAREILRKRRELEKEAGLGEFGSKAREIREGRKAKIEELFDKARESEVYAAGAEAAGKIKPTGRRGLAGLLDVAAPTIAAMGKSAVGIQRQRAEALDKLAEGEERLALAQEQYQRGDIKDATTAANQAKKDMFTAETQLRGLQLKESYYNALGLAAKARAAGGGGFKLGDVTRATTAIADLQGQLKMLDPKKDAAQIAETQRLIQILKGGIGMAYARGTGASIEDTED
jgi:hypothetical protein